jgi:hypothetical protein
MTNEVWENAVSAAQSARQFLMDANGRLESLLAEVTSRYRETRLKIVKGLIGSDAEQKDLRAQMVAALHEQGLLKDALALIEAVELPDQEIALEQSELDLLKVEIDALEAEANDQIARAQEAAKLVQAVNPGATVTTTGTAAHVKLQEVNYKQQSLSQRKEKLTERRKKLDVSKREFYASFLQER